MKPIRRDSLRHTSGSRDAALRRLRSANRWLVAGSALLTAVFADLASSAFSGHPSSAAGASRAARRGHTATKPLRPPAQAPRAAGPQSVQPPAQTEAEAPAQASTEEGAPEQPSAPAQQAPEAAPEPREAESSEAPPSEPSEPVVSGGS